MLPASVTAALLSRRSALDLPLWCWLLPVVVGLAIWYDVARFDLALGALAAAAVVVSAARRPDRALLALVALLPVYSLLLAWLYARGLPAGVVRPLAAWKELLALGVVAAALGARDGRPHRFDRLDRIAIGFVICAAIYALVPQLLAADAPSGVTARLLAFRASAGFVILFLAARHVRLPAGFSARITRVALLTGVAVAVAGVYEFVADRSWNRFIVQTVGWTQYELEILDVRPRDMGDIRQYGQVAGREILRVGSVLVDPLMVGFLLLVGFAVGIERLVEGRTRGWAPIAVALIASSVMFTQTRSALLAALVITFLAFRPLPGRRTHQRVRFALVFAAGLAIAVPGAAATGLADRVTGALTGDDQSTSLHVEGFWRGIDTIVARPLGQGLGTSAGVGQRFGAQQTVITENSYLQVGVELGVVAMALFVAFTVVAARRLHRTARDAVDPATAAASTALTGLAVGAFFLHTWTSIPVAWTCWAVIGAVLGVAERRAQDGEPAGPTRGVYGLGPDPSRPTPPVRFR